MSDSGSRVLDEESIKVIQNFSTALKKERARYNGPEIDYMDAAGLVARLSSDFRYMAAHDSVTSFCSRRDIYLYKFRPHGRGGIWSGGGTKIRLVNIKNIPHWRSSLVNLDEIRKGGSRG